MIEGNDNNNITHPSDHLDAAARNTNSSTDIITADKSKGDSSKPSAAVPLSLSTSDKSKKNLSVDVPAERSAYTRWSQRVKAEVQDKTNLVTTTPLLQSIPLASPLTPSNARTVFRVDVYQVIPQAATPSTTRGRASSHTLLSVISLSHLSHTLL